MSRKPELKHKKVLIAELEVLFNREVPESTFYWYLSRLSITPNRVGYTSEEVRKLKKEFSKIARKYRVSDSKS